MTILYIGWIIFTQDFYLRYRRATLGAFWFFIPAILGIIAASVTASPFFREINHPENFGTLHILINILIFQSFIDGLLIPIQMLRRTRHLLRNTAVTPYSILIASLYMGIASIMTRLPLFFIAEYFFTKNVGLGWIFVQPINLALLFLGMGFGSILAPLSLIMLDIRLGLPFIQGFFLIITPVLYQLSDSTLMRNISLWNPLAYLLLKGQQQITHLHGMAFTPQTFVASTLSIAFILFAAQSFRKSVRRMADIL